MITNLFSSFKNKIKSCVICIFMNSNIDVMIGQACIEMDLMHLD